jgi:hypothetical protein
MAGKSDASYSVWSVPGSDATLEGVKPLTRAQLEGRKERAVRFTRDVLGDPDRASEIEAESLDDYAERRKMKLINSSDRRTVIMARTTKTKADLAAEVLELQDENEELKDQLSVIADIVAPADEDEDDDDDDDDEEDEDPD